MDTEGFGTHNMFSVRFKLPLGFLEEIHAIPPSWRWTHVVISNKVLPNK